MAGVLKSLETTPSTSTGAATRAPIYLGRGMWSFVCEECGQAYERLKSKGGRFCSLKCFGLHKIIPERVTCPDCGGQKAWGSRACRVCYGRRRRLSPMRSCRQCGNAVYRSAGRWAGSSRTHGAFCNRDCFAKFVTGARNPAYTHGLNPGQYPKAFRAIKMWIRVRDGDRCFICRITGRMDIHHIDRSKDHNEPWNLVTLCRPCHADQRGETLHVTLTLAARLSQKLSRRYEYPVRYSILKSTATTTTSQTGCWSTIATI